MINEKTENIEEKEEKRKIKVISEIDDKIGIQGQSFMKGQFKEALALADEIIELAKTEDLTSFIQEQEQLIARIKGIIEQREEKAREKIRAELVSELNKLEKEYNIAFKTEDYIKVEQVIKEVKKLILQSGDKKLEIKWNNKEEKFLDTRAKKEIVRDITNLIKESPELRRRFLFEDLKLRLTYLMQQVQEKGLTDHMEKLEEIRTETIAAEDSYRKVKKNIEELKDRILVQKEKKEFEKAITNCESLIQQAKTIESSNDVDEFSHILDQLKNDLKLEELKTVIQKLNTHGLELLKKGEILESLKKYETIRDSLKDWV
ncbi:MAG: hypothetical protein ACXAAH_09695 [Promethearchaeota archaeon]